MKGHRNTNTNINFNLILFLVSLMWPLCQSSIAIYVKMVVHFLLFYGLDLHVLAQRKHSSHAKC